MAQKVTSTDIKLALKEFHNGKPSYFITECKPVVLIFQIHRGYLSLMGWLSQRAIQSLILSAMRSK